TMSTIARDQLPAAGTWVLDTVHTNVGFVGRHMMVSRVRGHFSRYAATVEIAETPEDSSLLVSIDAASVDTGNGDRDNHLRSPDFLDVEQFPTIDFRSTSVTDAGDGHWKVTGDLTIRDVTRPVVLDVEFGGQATNPWGTPVAAFSATAEVDREDWGLTWNAALETGGFLVGKRIRLEIETELNPS
ncbi:MAG: YceI family protein, partial [Nocardioidaceae bacterium]